MSKRAGWVKYCLGCLGIAVLVGAIAGYMAYRWAANKIGQSFSMDPTKVTAKAAVDEFLSKLQVTPISIEPGTATPEDSPEATETPEDSAEATETPESTETPEDS